MTPPNFRKLDWDSSEALYIGHIDIQLDRLLNYLREGMDEDFGLNRFDGGTPGGRPGGSIDARGYFFCHLIVWHYARH